MAEPLEIAFQKSVDHHAVHGCVALPLVWMHDENKEGCLLSDRISFLRSKKIPGMTDEAERND